MLKAVILATKSTARVAGSTEKNGAAQFLSAMVAIAGGVGGVHDDTEKGRMSRFVVLARSCIALTAARDWGASSGMESIGVTNVIHLFCQHWLCSHSACRNQSSYEVLPSSHAYHHRKFERLLSWRFLEVRSTTLRSMLWGT